LLIARSVDICTGIMFAFASWVADVMRGTCAKS